MAKAIERGLKSQGESTFLIPVISASASKVLAYDKIAFGCPSMGVEVLEESDFDPFFTSIEGKLKGKKVALFGSYGWGDGQWMRDWQERTIAAGANVFEDGLIAQEAPDEAEAEEYGKRFAKA
jgi:flavodoxin short chain